jgi:hypothetical protein
VELAAEFSFSSLGVRNMAELDVPVTADLLRN